MELRCSTRHSPEQMYGAVPGQTMKRHGTGTFIQLINKVAGRWTPTIRYSWPILRLNH